MSKTFKIFDYGYCFKCKCMKNDVRVVLSHLFVPIVCEQISDYNVYCSGCKNARTNETWIIEKGMATGRCKMEMILEHFKLNKPQPFSKGSSKAMKVEIMNYIIDDYEKQDKLMNKILKKFFKDYYCFITELIIPYLHDRKTLYENTMELQMAENGYFSYNKCMYEIKPLLVNLLFMYVIDVICCDDSLVDMGRIKEYISDHVWNNSDD